MASLLKTCNNLGSTNLHKTQIVVINSQEIEWNLSGKFTGVPFC